MKKNFEIIDAKVDIYYTILIFNRDFYINKHSDTKILYTTKSIIIREIEKARYISLEYIKINIFLVNKLEEKLSIIKIS